MRHDGINRKEDADMEKACYFKSRLCDIVDLKSSLSGKLEKAVSTSSDNE